jgi:transposase-like protein
MASFFPFAIAAEAVLVWALKAFELVLQKQHATWAPALARLAPGVAERFGLSRQSVHDWVRRYKNGGGGRPGGHSLHTHLRWGARRIHHEGPATGSTSATAHQPIP